MIEEEAVVVILLRDEQTVDMRVDSFLISFASYGLCHRYNQELSTLKFFNR